MEDKDKITQRLLATTDLDDNGFFSDLALTNPQLYSNHSRLSSLSPLDATEHKTPQSEDSLLSSAVKGVQRGFFYAYDQCAALVTPPPISPSKSPALDSDKKFERRVLNTLKEQDDKLTHVQTVLAARNDTEGNIQTSLNAIRTFIEFNHTIEAKTFQEFITILQDIISVKAKKPGFSKNAVSVSIAQVVSGLKLGSMLDEKNLHSHPIFSNVNLLRKYLAQQQHSTYNEDFTNPLTYIHCIELVVMLCEKSKIVFLNASERFSMTNLSILYEFYEEVIKFLGNSNSNGIGFFQARSTIISDLATDCLEAFGNLYGSLLTAYHQDQENWDIVDIEETENEQQETKRQQETVSLVTKLKMDIQKNKPRLTEAWSAFIQQTVKKDQDKDCTDIIDSLQRLESTHIIFEAACFFFYGDLCLKRPIFNFNFVKDPTNLLYFTSGKKDRDALSQAFDPEKTLGGYLTEIEKILALPCNATTLQDHLFDAQNSLQRWIDIFSDSDSLKNYVASSSSFKK